MCLSRGRLYLSSRLIRARSGSPSPATTSGGHTCPPGRYRRRSTDPLIDNGGPSSIMCATAHHPRSQPVSSPQRCQSCRVVYCRAFDHRLYARETCGRHSLASCLLLRIQPSLHRFGGRTVECGGNWRSDALNHRIHRCRHRHAARGRWRHATSAAVAAVESTVHRI
jgi:hypothetical protein